jgi:hypothetical protein
LPNDEALRFQRTISIVSHQSLIRPRLKSHLIQNSVEFFHVESAGQPNERGDEHPHDR